MAVWRRWVFPILLVAVFGAIAVSVTKLAFFNSPDSSTTSPSGAITDPVAVAEVATVVNELTLAAKVAQDPEVTIRSSVTGTVTAVHVGDSASVNAGDALFTVKTSDPVQWVDIVAPENGTLGEFALLAGQDVSLGGDVAKLAPNRFHVLATVEPVQLYRLLDAPSEAQVTITGGPAPFSCTNLTTQVADEGTTSVQCRIPGDQVVFPGLPAELNIAVGVAEDVLTVPVTSVKGGSGSGIVWSVEASGTLTETKVKLGVNDGTSVEILEGLEEGAQIRQFVPGAAAPVEEFCYEIAPGEEYCETGMSW